jgi:hypothetical protein
VLKAVVRNEKGVIGADDHTQGPPINSEPVVIERTHSNKKRAPKAPAWSLAFGLLSISFSILLFRNSKGIQGRSRG